MDTREAQDAFVQCRTYGHAWDEFNPPGNRSPRGVWGHHRIVLRCTRCTTERYDYLDWAGDVMGRSYVYPPGYQGASLPRAQWRLELIRRRLRRNRRAS